MKKIDLSKNIKVSIDGFNSFFVDAPFSDIGAMVNNKMIENPLVCKNADSVVDSVEAKTLVAQKVFEVSKEDLEYKNIRLSCYKIDTLCKAYINGRLAFESNNAHIPVDVDVKELLVVGENTLKIEIESAVKYITSRQNEKRLPKNNNGTDGAAYIRKASCHFGWDWGPYVPYKYIDSIRVDCFNKRIENVEIRQNNGVVTVNADNADEMYILSPKGEKITSSSNEFVIENPELWYTHDISQKKTQPLYTVVIKNDEMTVEKKIGIRSIKLNREADEYGTNFQFVLNGNAIFAKGANVIPFSAIPEEISNDTVDYYLDLCIKSNFNIIRMWGGAEYSTDYLLERCDELGILVWQDFCYACLMYPFYEKEFLESCLEEARVNVKRMEHHPCLALWCGNNELEAMFSYMPRTTEIMKAYEQFFYHQLPDAIKDITDIDYIPTSPLGEKPFSKNTADEVGDTHMWNVWHGLKPLNYYQKRYTRFLSEFGLESLPSMSAIRQFANEDEFDLASEAFMSHQKCIGGNEKMMFYLKDRFDDPVHFEDLPYLTGIVQAECVMYAAEHFRRNKGRCNGAIFWQLNDVWCCPSWASVDYLGVPKALMFLAKNFFAPISASYDRGKLYLHNDVLKDVDVDVKITVMNKDKTLFDISKVFTVKANSIRTIFDYTLKADDVMRVELNGQSFYFDKVDKLERANIKAEYNGESVIVSADKYVRYVYLEDDKLEENYFSLLPNEKKVIKSNKPLNVKCENNIEFSRNAVKTAVSQLLYRLKPMNIANAFYYEHN